MKQTLNIGCLLICMSMGCSGHVERVGNPIAVKGTVTMKGKPLKDVSISLQPLEDGHMTQLHVKSDGSFEADVTPGKYAYSVHPSTQVKRDSRLQIPVEFRQASLTRVVSIEPGTDLRIAFD